MSNVPRTPDAVRNSKKAQNKPEDYQFPSDLGNVGTLLLFKEYSYGDRDVGGSGGIKNRQSLDKLNITSSIYLPLPEQMLDSTNLKVAASELGSLGNSAAKLGGITQDYADPLGEFVNRLSNLNPQELAASALPKLLSKGLDAIGAGGLQTGLEAGFGTTINPYAAMAFEGVNLKTFTWNWAFAPKSRDETKVLKTIITSLKKNSLPYYKKFTFRNQTIVAGRAFLSYPNICLPIIAGVNTLTMKPCMISNINIDYGAGGELAFLEGGDPAVVKIEITLQEMQIWTREDYNGSAVPPDNTNMSGFGFEDVGGLGEN